MLNFIPLDYIITFSHFRKKYTKMYQIAKLSMHNYPKVGSGKLLKLVPAKCSNVPKLVKLVAAITCNSLIVPLGYFTFIFGSPSFMHCKNKYTIKVLS